MIASPFTNLPLVWSTVRAAGVPWLAAVYVTEANLTPNWAWPVSPDGAGLTCAKLK